MHALEHKKKETRDAGVALEAGVCGRVVARQVTRGGMSGERLPPCVCAHCEPHASLACFPL